MKVDMWFFYLGVLIGGVATIIFDSMNELAYTWLLVAILLLGAYVPLLKATTTFGPNNRIFRYGLVTGLVVAWLFITGGVM